VRPATQKAAMSENFEKRKFASVWLEEVELYYQCIYRVNINLTLQTEGVAAVFEAWATDANPIIMRRAHHGDVMAFVEIRGFGRLRDAAHPLRVSSLDDQALKRTTNDST